MKGFRTWQPVFLQGKNVTFDRLTDIFDGLLARLTLRNTAWKAGTIGDPKTIFTRINKRLYLICAPTMST